jgi:hypothetical protein
MDRLYELDLFDRWINRETLSKNELKDLDAFRSSRKERKMYSREYNELAQRAPRGEVVDEDRLYCLELMERQKEGDTLTEDETLDLIDFQNEVKERKESIQALSRFEPASTDARHVSAPARDDR